MATANKATAAKGRRSSKKDEGPDPLEGFSESLEIHEVTGVLLDTEDPNYDAMREIEDLKAELQAERMRVAEGSAASTEDITRAQLAAEKARLTQELREARQATEAVVPATEAAVAQVEATMPPDSGSES